MITKEIALSLTIGQTLFHIRQKNSDGSRLRAKVNGRVQIWKTRPNDFRIPMKYGMYQSGCFNIINDAYTEFGNPSNWELEDN